MLGFAVHRHERRNMSEVTASRVSRLATERGPSASALRAESVNA